MAHSSHHTTLFPIYSLLHCAPRQIIRKQDNCFKNPYFRRPKSRVGATQTVFSDHVTRRSNRRRNEDETRESGSDDYDVILTLACCVRPAASDKPAANPAASE